MLATARHLLAKSRLRQLSGWSLAHAAVRVEEYLFDYLVYPFMLYRGGAALLAAFGLRATPGEGYAAGFAFMLLVSLSVNLAYVHVYDRTRRDWFGFEALRSIEARHVPGRLRLPVRIALFGYLSLAHSPFFATLWLRSRTEAFAMRRADWAVFAFAVLLANVGWTVLVSGAVELWRQVLVPAAQRLGVG